MERGSATTVTNTVCAFYFLCHSEVNLWLETMKWWLWNDKGNKTQTIFLTVVVEPLSTHTLPVYDPNNF